MLTEADSGAWRTGDKGNHTALAKDFCSRGLAVAIVNYRLSTRDEPDQTPKVLHPSHVSDVHDALRLLAKRGSWKDVTLVGHSVGAWLVLAALVTEGKDMPRLEKDIQAGIGKVVLVDGIYDLVDLLHEYPSYSSFVEQAFIAPADGPKPKEWYSSVSLASWRLVSPLPSVHLWHSRDDELLSFKQTLDAARVLDYGNTQPRTVPIPTDGLAATTGENKTPLAKTYPDFAVRNVNVDLESLHVSAYLSFLFRVTVLTKLLWFNLYVNRRRTTLYWKHKSFGTWCIRLPAADGEHATAANAASPCTVMV